MSKPVVRISVRAVVETTLHESDLAPAASSAQRMQEGAIAHRARQSSAQEREYRKEVALSADYEGEALTLHVAGRADGIFLIITQAQLAHAGIIGKPLILFLRFAAEHFQQLFRAMPLG